MIHLITGGSGSGKSAFAENCVMQSGAFERFYIATMKVWGEEGRRRVEKHRKMRQGKGFVTIECETDLNALCLRDYQKNRITDQILPLPFFLNVCQISPQMRCLERRKCDRNL
ncbi:MAG: bifunctional adenosylcobinamide kinase/adenosylcobinamide-phosphate guanylyltransferase [Lachnospiraceae bacterium]